MVVHHREDADVLGLRRSEQELFDVGERYRQGTALVVDVRLPRNGRSERAKGIEPGRDALLGPS